MCQARAGCGIGRAAYCSTHVGEAAARGGRQPSVIPGGAAKLGALRTCLHYTAQHRC